MNRIGIVCTMHLAVLEISQNGAIDPYFRCISVSKVSSGDVSYISHAEQRSASELGRLYLKPRVLKTYREARYVR